MISLNSTVVAVKDQVFSNLGDEAVILHLKKGVYYGLNPTGAFIWNLVQSPRSAGELHRLLLENYETASDRCEKDLADLLNELAKEGLVEVTDAASA